LGQAYQSGSAGASGGSGGAPGEEPYGEQPYGGSGAQPYGGQPSGAQPYGGQPSGAQPYGGQPSGAQPYGGQPSGGAPNGGPPGTGPSSGPYAGPPGTGPYAGPPGRWLYGAWRYPRPNSGNVGGNRAFFARLLSASGWFAFQASPTRRRGSDGRFSIIHYNRRPLRTLALPLGCLALGLAMLASLMTGATNASPTSTSVDSVYRNGPPTDSDDMPLNWVTLSGQVGSWSADASGPMHESDRIYLLLDPGSGSGIVVKSARSLGEAGTTVEVAGMLVSIGGISEEDDFVDQAIRANPSVPVAHYVLDATQGAPFSGSILAFPLVLLLGLFFLIGVPTSYVVFIADRQNPPSSPQEVPGEDTPVHLSGLMVDGRGKLVRLREVTGRLSQGYYGLLTGPVTAFAEALPAVEFELGTATDARTGWVYPWSGPRPAFRVKAGGHDVVLSFDSTTERDKWASLILGAQGG
jgi:hypothetical protein